LLNISAEIRIAKISEKLNRKLGQREALQAALQKVLNEQIVNQEALQIIEQVRKLLEIFIKSTEARMRSYIEPIVNEALKFVFNQNLYFHVYLASRRNQVEADFIILRSEADEETYQKFILEPVKYAIPLEQLVKERKNLDDIYGGAVSQVLSLILVLVFAELLKVKGAIWLDEPSSAVHSEYNLKLGQLVSSLSRRFDRQYVIVTHSAEFASYSDITYRVKKIGDIATVEKLEGEA